MGPADHPVTVRPEAGQTLILHFWATWCPTCIDDLVHLQVAAATCREERARIIAVNVGESEADVSAFAAQHSLKLPVLRDPKGRVWRSVDGRGLPTNLFWSQQGRRSEIGPKSEIEWQHALASFECDTATAD
jgi:peroxiredoxin